MLDASSEPALTPEKAEQLIKDLHLINPILIDCTSSEDLALTYVDYMAAGFLAKIFHKDSYLPGFSQFGDAFFSYLANSLTGSHLRKPYSSSLPLRGVTG